MLLPDEVEKLQKQWEKNGALVPFKLAGGQKSAKIVLVGEAWSEHEAKYKHPFVGYSGAELGRMLGSVGLCSPITSKYMNEPSMIGHWSASKLFLTNVFNEHPQSNNLELWCGAKKEMPPDYSMPFLKSGKYIQPEFLPHVDRLLAEINAIQPNIVICLGNVACWAILRQTTISRIRGSVTWSKFTNCKVLPTYHPAAVLRDWSLRTIVLQDFMKASREAHFPELRRPQRWVLTNPTLEDIFEWMRRPAEIYAVDIETKNKQITMIGFARNRADAIVIPFIVGNGKNYWATHEDEKRAWELVRELLMRPIPKVLQNGVYDLSYLTAIGIFPKNCIEDTMLLHHAMYPELPKGLEFLGSIYTDEASWKFAHHQAKDTSNKRDA